MNNETLAALLEEAADLMEIRGENDFKVRAYRTAARGVEKHPTDVALEADPATLAGVGKSLAAEIRESVRDGTSAHLRALRASLPPGLPALLRVPGLGPKKVKALWEQLGVSTLGELEYACAENRLLTLSGFGPKSQDNVRKAVGFLKSTQGRFLAGQAMPVAEALRDRLRRLPQVARCEVAGSLRRGKPVVKDIDLVAAVPLAARAEVAAALADGPDVAEVVGRGDTKVSVRLAMGLGVDLRMVESDEFPAALHHFTGSKEHHVLLRQRARARGWSISEYGLQDATGERRRPESEDALYTLLGLAPIPPELREGRDELEAAEAGPLPPAIHASQVAGVLHNHSAWSDGTASIEAMALRARDLGYHYLSINDHSQVAVYAHGLSADRLRAQAREIQEVQERVPDVRILRGIEVDILADGTLDLPDDVLAELDVVVASVHSVMGQPRDEMTRRLVRAVRHPLVTVLGHPTGRLLLGREGVALDLDAVLDAAAETRTVLEINANPHRLDLDEEAVRRGAARGVRFAINPDAHGTGGLTDVRYGVAVARRAGLLAHQVFNTQPVDVLLRECAALRDWKASLGPARCP